MHKARIAAGLVHFGLRDAALLMRRDHRVQHLRDGTLLGERQRLDQFQLLPDLLLRPALLRRGCCRRDVVRDQRIERGLQGLRDQRQQ